jgi:hypothetical protein
VSRISLPSTSTRLWLPRLTRPVISMLDANEVSRAVKFEFLRLG